MQGRHLHHRFNIQYLIMHKKSAKRFANKQTKLIVCIEGPSNKLVNYYIGLTVRRQLYSTRKTLAVGVATQRYLKVNLQSIKLFHLYFISYFDLVPFSKTHSPNPKMSRLHWSKFWSNGAFPPKIWTDKSPSVCVSFLFDLSFVPMPRNIFRTYYMKPYVNNV